MDHGHQVVGVHLVADLDANGVADATHELHVGCIQLAGALPAPQEVACQACQQLRTQKTRGHDKGAIAQQVIAGGSLLLVAMLQG